MAVREQNPLTHELSQPGQGLLHTRLPTQCRGDEKECLLLPQSQLKDCLLLPQSQLKVVCYCR